MEANQIRAARALLNWSQDQLASEAGVSVTAIRNYERGATAPIRATLAAIQRALEAAGVEFIERGVRLKADPAP